MASKSKAARLNQISYWEGRLEERLKTLSEEGKDPQRVAKDPIVRKIRAKIRETQSRLNAIEAKEKKNEEMARRKAQKAAAPKKEKGKKKKSEEEKQALSKRQQKKLKKKEQKTKS
ncbi:MAG: hypothetical protein DRH12_03230 [Deltaproteobacteria bacterium]|nr:MAG: hypothetical protein DRH12_03230 [Deltaproteobacteria bacterium]